MEVPLLAWKDILNISLSKMSKEQNIIHSTVPFFFFFFQSLILHTDIHNSVFPACNISGYPWLVISRVI